MLKTLNTTNSIFQIIAAELEAQQTQNTTPVAQQEVTPKPTTKTTKTTKTPKISTIQSTYTSTSTQHGHFVPSLLKPNITHISHTTTLSINSITRGYTLGCTINGEEQVSAGDIYYTNWMLRVQAGDIVEVTVIGGESTKTITYTINEGGVVASASEGINHSLKGTHKAELDIQDKYRKQAAQQPVEAPAPAPVTQETPAQIEEETVSAPAQEGQVLTFGKHTGKALSSLDNSYLKWLVSHESRVAQGNRWACTAAKAILAARQAQEEQKAA